MSKLDLILKNGIVFLPQGRTATDVGVKDGKIVEIGKGIPEKTKDGRYRLPKGWIAIKSLFKQGRVFYYNVETHRSSWVRPLQADFVEEEEYELASVDSRALVTWTSHVDDASGVEPPQRKALLACSASARGRGAASIGVGLAGAVWQTLVPLCRGAQYRAGLRTVR